MPSHSLRVVAVLALLTAPFLLTAETVVDLDREDIRGGIPTTHAEFPFIVFVRTWSGDCTGSLIAPDWVLTAAHCVDGDNVNDVEVIWGWPWEPRFRGVKALYIHPNYDGSDLSRGHDIALLQLEFGIPSPARFVRLADSALASYADEGRELRSVGYAGQNGVLKHAESPLSKCPSVVTAEAFLCVFRPNAALAEPGDSGGPLLLRMDVAEPEPNEHTEYVLMGVISAEGSQGARVWTEYIPIAPSLDWIRSVVTGSPSPIPPPPPPSACPLPPPSEVPPPAVPDPGGGETPDGERIVPTICVPLGDRGYGLRLEYYPVPGTGGYMNAWWVGGKQYLLWVFVKDLEGQLWEVSEKSFGGGDRWTADPETWTSVASIMYDYCDDNSNYACRLDLYERPEVVCIP